MTPLSYPFPYPYRQPYWLRDSSVVNALEGNSVQSYHDPFDDNCFSLFDALLMRLSRQEHQLLNEIPHRFLIALFPRVEFPPPPHTPGLSV